MATLGVLEYLISVNTGNIDLDLKKSESKVKGFGERLSAFTIAKGQMIGNFASKAISSVANVMKGTLKSAVSSFADYEQLVGGVETLFKDTSVQVIKFAEQAYKTAGISANEYMETVTSFSASLLQSLGNDTDKAADYADMAIKDMADNANKMGSSMQSIQNAYQGFAKQNYTMLDNLKLGYGGTKSEMQRLLQDAGKLVNRKFDIKNLSDVYEAIHIIQQELQITGTTEKEAMSTVTGSMNATKAAWKNVLTAIGRGKDIKKAISNFAKTAKTAVKNLKPVIMDALGGIGTAAKELFPVILDIARDVIKELYQKVSTWFNKNIWQPIVDYFNDAWKSISQLWEGTKQAISAAWSLIATWFDTTVWTPLKNFFTSTWDTIVNLWTGVKEAISGAWAGIANWFNTTVWTPLKTFFEDPWGAITNLWTGVKEAISGAWTGIANWFNTTVWQPIKDFFQPVWDFISNLWTNISTNLTEAWGAVTEALTPIIEPIKALFQGITDVVNGISSAIESVINWIKELLGYDGKSVSVKSTITKETVNVTRNEDGSTVTTYDDGSATTNFDNGGVASGREFAKGNWNVPYDNFPALLHRGELVMNKSQARQYRDAVQESNTGVNFTKAINDAFSKVYVMMSGEKVGDLTTKRVKNNINASSYSRIRAYGG